MLGNIIFHESSGFNTLTVIFFSILILFLPIGLSMFSSTVRNKMGYEREKTDYKYHLGVFIITGIVGVYCMYRKQNKVDTIELKSQNLVLKGYFGNEIASFSCHDLTDVQLILKEGSRSVETNVYVVVIYAKDKAFYTNYLNGTEASSLNITLKYQIMKSC